MPTNLSGKYLLLVEDEYFIAEDLRRSLEDAGAEIPGPTGRVDEALRLMKSAMRIDGAVLDVNLHDVMVYPVAEALRTRGVPFIFTTGYERSALPEQYADVLSLEKPVEPMKVAEALFGAATETCSEPRGSSS